MASISREDQIVTFAELMKQFRKNRNEEVFTQCTPELIARDLRDYGVDCFDAWYLHNIKGRVVGKITNDNGEAFYEDILKEVDDASSVTEIGTEAHDRLTARLLTRYVTVDNFSI